MWDSYEHLTPVKQRISNLPCKPRFGVHNYRKAVDCSNSSLLKCFFEAMFCLAVVATDYVHIFGAYSRYLQLGSDGDIYVHIFCLTKNMCL